MEAPESNYEKAMSYSLESRPVRAVMLSQEDPRVRNLSDESKRIDQGRSAFQ